MKDRKLEIRCSVGVILVSLLLIGLDGIKFFIGVIAAIFSGIRGILLSIPLVVWLVLLVLK